MESMIIELEFSNLKNFTKWCIQHKHRFITGKYLLMYYQRKSISGRTQVIQVMLLASLEFWEDYTSSLRITKTRVCSLPKGQELSKLKDVSLHRIASLEEMGTEDSGIPSTQGGK